MSHSIIRSWWYSLDSVSPLVVARRADAIGILKPLLSQRNVELSSFSSGIALNPLFGCRVLDPDEFPLLLGGGDLLGIGTSWLITSGSGLTDHCVGWISLDLGNWIMTLGPQSLGGGVGGSSGGFSWSSDIVLRGRLAAHLSQG